MLAGAGPARAAARGAKSAALPCSRWCLRHGFLQRMFYAPVIAVEKLMRKMGVDIHHWDLIEANEAFAAQSLVDGRELGWDWERVNVNGGAIALGHPIGASGSRKRMSCSPL